MPGALVPVDAEALVIAYLTEVLPDVSVAGRVLTRDAMVVVEQTGGTRVDHVIDLPQITIQVWDSTASTASRLCRTAFARVLSIRDHPVHGHLVREVRVVGLPVHFPDPTAGAERYQCTVQLNTRPTENGERA